MTFFYSFSVYIFARRRNLFLRTFFYMGSEGDVKLSYQRTPQRRAIKLTKLSPCFANIPVHEESFPSGDLLSLYDINQCFSRS